MRSTHRGRDSVTTVRRRPTRWRTRCHPDLNRDDSGVRPVPSRSRTEACSMQLAASRDTTPWTGAQDLARGSRNPDTCDGSRMLLDQRTVAFSVRTSQTPGWSETARSMWLALLTLVSGVSGRGWEWTPRRSTRPRLRRVARRALNGDRPAVTAPLHRGSSAAAELDSRHANCVANRIPDPAEITRAECRLCPRNPGGSGLSDFQAQPSNPRTGSRDSGPGKTRPVA